MAETELEKAVKVITEKIDTISKDTKTTRIKYKNRTS